MRSIGFGDRRSGRAWARRAALGALALALAGCSVAPRETRAGFEALGDSSAPVVGGGGDPRAPMAELPLAAGATLAVLQTSAHSVLSQRVVLKGDADTLGENYIVVKVNNDPGPWDIDGPVGIPTREMIAAELDQEFAGVEMKISDTFERNSFGPFGYALGHPSSRLTCIYAWEFGVFKWSKLGEPPTGAPSMPIRPTSVRVRMCRSTIGEAEIVPMLRQLQVYPSGSRTPYVDPTYTGEPGAGDALAAAGVHYFVVPGAKPAPVERPVRTDPAPRPRHAHFEPRRRRRHEHRMAAAVEDRAVAEPDAGSVAVPMPGGGAPVAARPAPAANPLLAPLAGAAARPVADDMPLPSRAAAAPSAAPAAAPRAASIPLPN